MNFSEKSDELIKALYKCYIECEPVTKNKQNDFLKSKYADLQEVMDTIKPYLKANDLLPIQSPTGEFGLHTRIVHVPSGQYVEDTFTIIPSTSNPQIAGAVITYQRRYAIVSMLGLIVEDDDGNSVSKPVESKTDLHKIINTINLAELRKLWEENPEWHEKKEYIQAVSLQKNKLEK